MSSRTPVGFYVAAIFAATFGALMALAVLALDGESWHPWETVLLRGPAAVLAALSAVAAEALWRARPWAWRASLALALAYGALVTLICVVMRELQGVFAAIWILLVSAPVVVPLLLYIRNRSADLFGTPFVRRPAVYATPPVSPPLHRPPPPPPLPTGQRPPPWW